MRTRILPIVAAALVAACGGSDRLNAHDVEFRDAAAAVDRVDVSFPPYGGGDELKAFAVIAPEDVRRFVDLFRFEDVPAEGACLCKGFVDFDLRRGEARVLHLSLHAHWSVEGVPWGVQAKLTRDSTERLCRWLASCGAPRALEIWSADVRKDAADAARSARQSELIGDDVRRRIDAASVPRDAFVAALPDVRGRASAAFRLCAHELGARPGDRVSDAAVAALDAMSRAELASALAAARSDVETARGADVWLVAHGGHARLDSATSAEATPPAVDRLLGDPNPDVRTAAVTGLHGFEHSSALQALRRSLDDADPHVRYRAAGQLIDRRDRESVPRIRAVVESLSGHERDDLTVRLTWL